MKPLRAFYLLLSCALCLLPYRACCESGLRRGLFVTVVQDPQVLSSRDGIEKLIEFARKARIEDLYVQVYYANRSWFRSKEADQEPYEACLKSVSEDPFGLLIRRSHEAGIRVHAWLNLLSLGNNKDAVILKKHGADILTRNRRAKRAVEDYRIDNQYFLEPGDGRVCDTLAAVVEEVVTAYPDLDGIIFDYIRYPDTNPAYGYTAVNMERYRKATGYDTIGECDKAWKDWKRLQVTELLKRLSEKARALRPGIMVSATGCMPYLRAYYEAFQDWPSWLDGGIVDSVTLMSYSPYPDEFARTLARAKSETRDFSKVNAGLGAYRLVRSPGVFEEEFKACGTSGAGGFAIFHYGSLCEDPALGDVLSGGRHE